MHLTTTNFSLSIKLKPHSTVLIMQFFNDAISTSQFPHTKKLLQLYAPKVLQTKCFNPLHLTFRKEVINTELGHLFEHILLSYLCEETINDGADSALYDAVTHWNWRRYPKGNFKIVLQGRVNKAILQQALTKSIQLIELLFSNTNYEKITSTNGQQPLVRPLSANSLIIN